MSLNSPSRRGLVIACFALAAGCSSTLRRDAAADLLAGRVWETRAQAFVGPDVVRRAVRGAEIVLLGETHDNLEHHRLQRVLLEEMLAVGRRPALVMEQFDREFDAALAAEHARAGRTADSVLDAGHFSRRSWQVEGYRPLVALALEFDLPIVAGNLSRSDARAIVRDPAKASLPPVDKDVERALAADIDRSHCGEKVAAPLLAGMVAAQRARDLTMAQSLSRYRERGAVLIAGAGHVRVDRGAPLYLARRPLVIAFIEVDPDRRRPADYFDGEFATAASFDFLWFTPRAAREDPCEGRPALEGQPAS
jgi:uncharacterized iron-regulated protein